LDSHKQNYGITELETLDLVWAIKYFRPDILGHRTTVYTDHVACTSLLNTTCPSGKLARWALAIQEINLVIKHQSGKKNANADALSINPTAVVCVMDATESESKVSTENVTEALEVDLDEPPTPEGKKMAELQSLQRVDLSLVFM
jgi:hypothetical protein